MVKTMLDAVKKYSVFTIAVSIILGLLFLIFPNQSIKFMCIAAGVAMAAAGVAGTVHYFVKSHSMLVLSLAIISAVAGIIICFKYESLIMLIGIIFGVFIMTSGIIDFIASIDAARAKNASWILTIILSLISIVFGIIIIFNSFEITSAIVRIVGIGLLVYSVTDIISLIQFHSVAKTVEQAIINESEIIDDNAQVVSKEDED